MKKQILTLGTLATIATPIMVIGCGSSNPTVTIVHEETPTTTWYEHVLHWNPTGITLVNNKLSEADVDAGALIIQREMHDNPSRDHSKFMVFANSVIKEAPLANTNLETIKVALKSITFTA